MGKKAILSKSYAVFVTSLMVTLAHASYIIIPDCDKCVISILPMAVIGIAFSIYVIVIWTPIPDVVEPGKVGTAYGVLMSALSLGLAIGPINVGQLRDYMGDYFLVSIYFTAFGVLGVVSGVLINIEDSRTGGVLNAVPRKDDGDIEEPLLDVISEDRGNK